MKLERYDVAATRVCASTNYNKAAPERLVPGARWDPAWVAPGVTGAYPRKVWHWPIQSTPVLVRTFPGVTSDDPQIAAALRRANDLNAIRTATLEYSRELGARFDDLALPTTPTGKALRKHQRDGVRATLLNGGSRGLFHQTGTGKTITAGTLLSMLTRPVDGFRVSVVVCPVTLIDSAWSKDLVEWFPDLPFVSMRDHSKGQRREMAVASALRVHGRVVVLTNYEAVRTDKHMRKIMSGAYVVLDEASKAKGEKSAIAVSLRESACTWRGCVMLSGTPAPNGNHEYWSLAKILASPTNYDAFPGGHSAFTQEFCDVKTFTKRGDHGRKRFGGFTFKESQAAALHERLAPICEWVRKEECLDLPPKSYVDVPIALDTATASVYAEMRDAMIVKLRGKYATAESMQAHAQNALVQMLRLRQITAGFVPAVKDDWIEGDERVLVPIGREKIDWLIEHADADGERIVLWTQFIFEAARYVKLLREAGIRCESITGETREQDRAGIFRGFVAGDYQILVAHPGVAKYGVSLPGVSQACYGSLSYALEEYAQSQDRIHGIGRGDASKRSTFYRLVGYAHGAPTIDQDLLDVLDGKRKLLDLVFEIDKDRRAAGFVPSDVGQRIDAT